MDAELRMGIPELNLLIEGMNAMIEKWSNFPHLTSDVVAMKEDLEEDLRAISH